MHYFSATTTVILNSYVDKMFNFLRKIIVKDNLNTVPLSKETIKVRKSHYYQTKNTNFILFQVRHAGHCELSHGTLKDIATIFRTNNAFISYNKVEKKVTLAFPFKFSDLKVIMNTFI